MNLVNAIAKVRFGSAKPQRIQLHKSEAMLAEILCMEPGQQLNVTAGEWTYYVVTGGATLTTDGKDSNLSTGQFAAVGPKEPHTLANAAEQRLVCLAVTTTS
jgi:mannose-6-phosphate isomerase-like protein (cupin superfamily)